MATRTLLFHRSSYPHQGIVTAKLTVTSMTNTRILGLGLIMVLFGCQGEQPAPTTVPAPPETPVSAIPTASIALSPIPIRSPSPQERAPQPAPPAPTTASVSESAIPESFISEATLIAKDPKAQINLRSTPSAKGKLLGYGVVGDRVTVMAEKETEGYTWSYVKFSKSGAKGWVRGDFIKTDTKSGQTSNAASPSPSVSPTPAAGSPSRKSVAGNCECPYDTDARGRACGGRSAYSKASGRKPVCYVGES